jgi:hypothetical protein
MIRLVKAKLTPEEYQKIFAEGFGEYNGELPQSVVLVCDGDTRVGFFSAYVHSLGNLYLQHMAFARDSDPGKRYQYFVETIEMLHDLGYPFLMGAVHNKNKRALLWAIRSGFEIHGIRQNTTGELYVEILHVRRTIQPA